MRLHHRYSIVLLTITLTMAAACSSYKELVIEDKIFLTDESSGFKFTNAVNEKTVELKSGRHKSLLISSKKYLAVQNNFSPEAGIINKGVEETLKGNYFEAEVIFKQVQDNLTDGSVDNNLAVVYELTRRRKDAMKMYMKALMKSPENSMFRSNLLSFINHNKFGQEKQVNTNSGVVDVKR